MIATISWWNLDRSTQTIESLRTYLHGEGVTPWEKIRGMRMKFWISDPANNLWGAVVLWEAPEAMSQSLPPNRATELIGYPPTWRSSFEVEALIDEGAHAEWFAASVVSAPALGKPPMEHIQGGP
jgi:hypothetical protein